MLEIQEHSSERITKDPLKWGASLAFNRHRGERKAILKSYFFFKALTSVKNDIPVTA